MTLLISPAELAAPFTGQPVLLVLEGVTGVEALAMPGLSLWLVAACDGQLRLHRPGERPEAATLPLPAAPAALLGIVAPDAEAAAPLLLAWQELAPEPPPLLLASKGEAALPLLARRAVAALAEAGVEAARLHRGLVATRRDYEDTRAVVMALEQSIGHDIPPPPALALTTEPGLDLAVRAEAGRLALGQVLHLPVDNICAVSLHLAEARLGPAARLRVRLYGVESGRVLGAWLLPGEAVTPGWLTLDLAAPVVPLRETAALDILAELAPGEALVLSQEDAPAATEQAVQQPGGPIHRHALAVRAWIAPQGRRFCLPQYWDWEQLDLPLPPKGVPVVLPAQAWEGCCLAAGQGGMAALGGASPRPVLRPTAGNEAMALLPMVPVTGLDLLEANLAVLEGDAAGLEAALWLQPAGCAATAADALSLAAPGARFSGWRRLEAGQERLSITQYLPLDGPPAMAVALVLRRPTNVPGSCEVEWTELFGRRLGRLAAPAAQRRAEPGRLPAARQEPELSGVRLQEYYVTPDGGYRHLDLLLERPRLGGTRWPVLRCKLALNGGVAQLEFRLRPDWPVMFESWPGHMMDEYGPLFLLPETEAASILATRIPSARDVKALQTVLLLLPRAVASLELPGEVGDPALWRAIAERLAATVPATA